MTHPNSAAANILTSDNEINESIRYSHGLMIIDGKIEGEVVSGGDLMIGENAECVGAIRTRSITVFGRVQGNITVGGRCVLKSDSSVEGDIAAATLAVEEGASFLGKSSVGKRLFRNGSSY